MMLAMNHASLAENNGTIGPRNIDGYSLTDVSDDGNCFYYAVAAQLKSIAPQMLANTKELTGHDFIRKKVQKDNFKNGEWADDSHFNQFVQNFSVALAIIDTRNPINGFNNIRYYDGQNIIYKTSLDEIPDNMPVVKIAATGNHFLSVAATSENSASFVSRVECTRGNINEPKR